MKKLSGLVLDVRDDHDGAVIRSIFPTHASVPDLIKSAAILTPELDARLPDDLFAVVLLDDGVTLRKFACIDAGNTALSVEYFLKTAHKLPIEAQKTAAQNLITACGWYGFKVPDSLEKIALGLGTMLNLGLTAPGMAHQAKMNLAASSGAGPNVVTPTQRQQLLKGAEVSGTELMPNAGPAAEDLPAPASKTVIKKSASSAGFVGDHGIEAGARAVMPDDNSSKSISAEQPKRLPQSPPLRPHVDVSGKEAPGILTIKKAEAYALPSLEHFPLDSYEQVKAASAYFDEYSMRMEPRHRHEYCSNMVGRAHVLGIAVSDVAEKYASSTYADLSQIEIALDGRRLLIQDDVMLGTLDKLAELRPFIKPEDFALTLGEFDKMAGIDYLYDRDIIDPYLSTFGVKKEAADSISIGNDVISVKQLKRLAAVGYATVKHRFGDVFADKFVKNPVDVFNSLPLDQKKIMMRIVSDNGAVDGEITV